MRVRQPVKPMRQAERPALRLDLTDAGACSVQAPGGPGGKIARDFELEGTADFV